ncbi:MAG: anti-sigma factor family protein [Blastocatellia bacterium]
MKCESCQSVLEEYFDGELPAKGAAEVRAHLANCSACAAEIAEMRQSHELYARYERDIEVTPALWAGIEARIKAEKATLPDQSISSGWRDWLKGLFAMPHISPAFAAALVVLAIGLTVVVMSYLNSRNAANNGDPAVATKEYNNGNNNSNGTATPAPTPGERTQQPTIASTESGHEKNAPENKEPVKDAKPAPQKQLVAANRKPQSPPDPMKLVREAEQKYLEAIAIMSQDVKRHRSQIDPAVLARFDSALSDIDRTIAETRQIVRRNPDDPVALQYLLSAYAKKVDTLRAMTLD